jgi:hypothetical protein
MTEQKKQGDEEEQDFDFSGSDQITAIKEKLHQKQHNHSELNINRVPDKAINQLQELAYEKFAGDYGATLSYLLEIHNLTERFSTQQQEMMERITQLENYVREMEEKQNQEEDEGSKVDTIG